MKILHYFLGFPPYRSGGLTKYAIDLMKAQVLGKNTVSALWPGQIRCVNKKTCIKKRKSINGIKNYELINPLPVPLDEGINEFDAYMKSCDIHVYLEFLNSIKPDVIHIHTLMGLHKEFMDAAKKLKIRTIFTTHDYFGICPKVTLFRYNRACENDHDCKDCVQCNYNPLSLKKIQILQSPIYRILKNSSVVKQLRKHHRKEFFMNDSIPKIPITKVDTTILATKYRNLREYYINMLSAIDLIHFNSTVAESIYKKYFIPKSSCVLTITHEDISDNQKSNKWVPTEVLRITYLASAKPFKGFKVLKDALDELWEFGNHKFELKIFSQVQDPSPYMKIQEEGFKYDQLGNIFADTDVLVAPSVWYETFGFTVLEAISYGVPVIVSDRVGAKDVVGNGGIVVKAASVESLRDSILSLSTKKIIKLRENVSDVKTWDRFVAENMSLYLDLWRNNET